MIRLMLSAAVFAAASIAGAQTIRIELPGRAAMDAPGRAASGMPSLPAGAALSPSLTLSAANALPLSAPAASLPASAPIAAAALVPGGVAASASASHAAALPAHSAAADAPRFNPVAIEAAAAPAQVEGARSALTSAGRTLNALPSGGLQRMPVEDLGGAGRSIMESVLGTEARTDPATAIDAHPSAPMDSLRPSEARDAAAEPSVPAPKRFDRRRLVWPGAVAFVWTAWAALMTSGHHWALFAHNWFMSVTMAAGSFVAGASSEGSGAISFPVMTLLFHIKPAVARDFALMIQSVGMTTAALTILAMGIKIEKRAVLVGALAGFAGMALGMLYIAPLFAPPFAKMFFTSLWAAFALALWRLNRDKTRTVVDRMQSFGWKDAAMLAAFGVAGGVVSSIVGTGLCMVMFMLLVLGHKMSEKVATPTSVVLMATNALFGFFFKTFALGGMSPEAWNYWWVCVPIVVIGAPLGARFMKDKSRHFVARFLYAAIALQLLAALLIIHQTIPLLLMAAATFVGGTLAFRFMARKGAKEKEKTA